MLPSTGWIRTPLLPRPSARQHYPDTKLMLCGGHAARAPQKALKKIQAKKSFTDDEKK